VFSQPASQPASQSVSQYVLCAPFSTQFITALSFLILPFMTSGVKQTNHRTLHFVLYISELSSAIRCKVTCQPTKILTAWPHVSKPAIMNDPEARRFTTC
jgi:hypothetical protein